MSSACPWSPVSVYARRTMADHLLRMRAATRQLVASSRRVRQRVRKFSAHQLQTIRSAPHETGHGQMAAQLRLDSPRPRNG
jgi:hypothetical protein